jgi:RNA polymerase sigma-70 factor (ECF subfamily)
MRCCLDVITEGLPCEYLSDGRARRQGTCLDRGNLPVVRGREPFEVFYRREYDRAVRLAYVLSGSRWGAEDLAQDAFMDAHRKWAEIAAYENPGGWVRRVIANRSVSAYRRRLAEGRALIRLVAGSHTALPELAAATEEVWDAVRRLPRRQAQVTVLTYLDGLSLQEVADILDVSVPTVSTHLQRARKTLGRALAGPEEVGS